VSTSACASESRIVARSALRCSANSCAFGSSLTFPIWKIPSEVHRYFSRTWKQMSAILLHPNCMSMAVPFVSRTSAPECDNDHESLNVRMADHSGVKYRLYLCIVNAVTESPCSPHARRISASKVLRDCAQRGVIVGSFVVRAPRPASTSPPVEKGVPKASDHIAVPSFRIGVFLVVSCGRRRCDRDCSSEQP
jgi:hypothetical protein